MKEKKEHIRRSHNVTLLLYHIVLPAKYRRKIFTEEIIKWLIEICEEIEEQSEIYFLEIWADEDHVHFMVQWIPTMTVTRIITIIKSKSANYLFKKYGEYLKKYLWWWKLWTSWYYVNTVWAFAWEETIRNYIKKQWNKWYEKWYEKQIDLWQMVLFVA